MRLTDSFMRQPLKLLVKNEELTLEGIRQYYLDIEKEEYKLGALCDIYESISKSQGMIFCNTRSEVKKLKTQMTEQGHIVSAMVNLIPSYY